MNDLLFGIIVASISGIAAFLTLMILFPSPSTTFPATTLLSAEAEPTATLSITKIAEVDVKSIPLEVVERNPDLYSAIRHVEILHIGDLMCGWRAAHSPTAIISCEPSVYTTNVTSSSAESIVLGILRAQDTPPIDNMLNMRYELHFAIEDKGSYAVTISFKEPQY